MEIIDEHFVPLAGLDLETYLNNQDVGGVHHLIRYIWALEVLADLSPLNCVLDMACGSGYGSYLIAKKFPNLSVMGVDYDTSAIEYAQQNYQLPNLQYKVGDGTRWEETIGNTKFDCILSFDTLEHVVHREIMMQNLVEHLESTGSLLFSTPCSGDLELEPNWEYHKIEYSAASLYDFLKRYFRTISHREDDSLPHLNVFNILKERNFRYCLKMNPVVCQHPILITNPYLKSSKKDVILTETNLKIDLGCGSCKKPGTFGLDIHAQPGVDYVINFEKDPLPFADKTVQSVYSSHCLEHLSNPIKLFKEISRVCQDRATLEFWTPYAWENSAFIIDHKMFFNEDHYYHICLWFVDFWKNILNARWLLKEFTYIIEPATLTELYENKIDLDFAIKYYKGIVKEFGTTIEVCHTEPATIPEYKRTFAVNRFETRYPIHSPSIHPTDEKLKQALEWFSQQTNQIEKIPNSLQPDLNFYQKQYQHILSELEQSQELIKAMENTKFWQLRKAWLNIKQALQLSK